FPAVACLGAAVRPPLHLQIGRLGVAQGVVQAVDARLGERQRAHAGGQPQQGVSKQPLHGELMV
ncbi:hypothetical protein RZS08_14380, partial [Arthrospira platensis SPKY1]|nr:hypothetical protein [Arthrospira platensis SPKY1]